MLTFYLAILITLVSAIFLDLLVTRVSGHRLYGYATSLGIIFMGCPLAVLFNAPEYATLFSLILALGLGLMWWFIYLNVVQAVESSLRLRMLFEVKTNGGSLTETKLRDTYNDKTLITLRLKRLEEGKSIVKKEGKYYLQSKKLRKAAHFFTVLKKISTGRSSQFE